MLLLPKNDWETTLNCCFSFVNSSQLGEYIKGNMYITFLGGTLLSAQLELCVEPELHHHSGTYMTQSSEVGRVFIGSHVKENCFNFPVLLWLRLDRVNGMRAVQLLIQVFKLLWTASKIQYVFYMYLLGC